MKSQPLENVTELSAKFPFIGELITKCANENNIPSVVIIKAKADHDFLFVHGTQDTGGDMYVYRTGDNPQKGTMHDFLYLIDADDQLIKKLDYSNCDNSRVHPVLEIIETAGRNQGFAYELSYCIWVRVFQWFAHPSKSEKEMGITFGAYSHTNMNVTIHQEPDQGWQQLVDTIDFSRNVILNDELLMRSSTQEFDQEFLQRFDYQSVENNLKLLAKAFREKFYLNGFNEIASKAQRMSRQFDDVKLISDEYLGRMIFNFSDGKHEFTIYGEAGNRNSPMNYSEINATYPTAEYMVNRVISCWEKLSSKDREKLYTEDNKVQ